MLGKGESQRAGDFQGIFDPVKNPLPEFRGWCRAAQDWTRNWTQKEIKRVCRVEIKKCRGIYGTAGGLHVTTELPAVNAISYVDKQEQIWNVECQSCRRQQFCRRR